MTAKQTWKQHSLLWKRFLMSNNWTTTEEHIFYAVHVEYYKQGNWSNESGMSELDPVPCRRCRIVKCCSWGLDWIWWFERNMRRTEWFYRLHFMQYVHGQLLLGKCGIGEVCRPAAAVRNNKTSSERECIPRWWMSQGWNSGNTGDSS
jgi:hypothetical protein